MHKIYILKNINVQNWYFSSEYLVIRLQLSICNNLHYKLNNITRVIIIHYIMKMMKVCLPHDCAQWKFRKIINGHKPKEKK